MTQGRSLGSFFVSYLSSLFDLHSSILFCGFWSVGKIVEHKISSIIGKMIIQKCDNSEYLGQTKCKILIIHGMKVGKADQDDLIPYNDIVTMVDALKNDNINLVVTQDLEHNYYNEREDIQQPIFEFYDLLYPQDKVFDRNYFRNTLNMYNGS